MRERHDPKSIIQLVNDQCAKWEGRRKTSRELSRGDIYRPVLLLSGQVGTIERAVARRLSEELHMDLFAEEIVHAIAREARLSDRIVRTMDERGLTYAEEILNRLQGKNGMSPEAYFGHLVRVIVAIGRHGNSIVLGHGATYILRAPMNLHVRFIAPLHVRVGRVSEELGISAEEAERRIKILDQERRDFVRQYFGTDIDDVRHFDLVINNEFIDTDMAVRLVNDAFIGRNWRWTNRRSRQKQGAAKEEDECWDSASRRLGERAEETRQAHISTAIQTGEEA